MNLIDILNQILSTKNELREIVGEKSTDFSLLPVTIYNYLISFYNQGYNNGYRDKFLEETDNGAWSKDPLTPREYTPDSTNYDPYTLDGLVDMMESVLGYRLDIKDIINIDSDQFIIYPDYLRQLIESMSNTGYEQGRNAAAAVLLESESIETPTFSWDSSNNTFTITTTDTSLEIWFKLGENGVAIRYTNPVQLSSTTRVYYYAVAGASHSSTNTYYDCTVALSEGEEYLESPTIIQNGNSFSIVSNIEGGTIYYNLNSTGWKIYKSPIDITESGLSVQAYVFYGNKTSKVVSTNLVYYEETVLSKCNNVSLAQSSSNQITLSTTTTNASIYYRINDGEFQLYSSPFTIISQCIIYAYATKNGYEDSDILYWACTVSSGGSTRPKKPLIYQNQYIVIIHSYNTGAEIQYKYNYNDAWTSLGSYYTSNELYPESNTKVWARVVLNGVPSEEAVYDFYYWKDGFTIPAPTLSFINNRVVITNDGYSIYYTTDGRDPRKYGNPYAVWTARTSDGFWGIPISGPTLVRAISKGMDENYNDYWSEEVSDTFTPLEEGDEGYILSDEYFFVEGASEIHLSNVFGYRYILSYSYDRVNWTDFKSDVTGLDPSKRIYLRDASTTEIMKAFDSISFGAGDRVSVGGNILSIVYYNSENWFRVTETTSSYTFSHLFKNCTQLVDASKLVIPITRMNEFDFWEMFYGCTQLEAAPKELYFEDVPKGGCESMFEGCSKLLTTPKFNIRTIGERGCKRMFANCSKINSVSRFNISSIGKNGLEEAFLSAHSLRKVDMIINAVENSSYKNTFRNCRSLSARTYLNDSYYIDSISIRTSDLAEDCFYGTFAECYTLEEFGDLPGITAAKNCYYEMFLNATSLRKFGTISLTTTAQGCLYSTFEGTGLEKAPDLLTANLNGYGCYNRLFYNCSNLNYIKALFLTDPSSAQTQNWVYGVASEGTFVQDADATWNEVSVHAIPPGWVVNKETNDVGIITNIRCTDGQVSIFADRESEILYQINGTDGEWKQYTGPFNITVDSVIYARCRNNRGELGRIYQSELFKITASTSLIISYSNNVINIEAPSGVVYNYIYYRITNYQSTSFNGDWITYTTPIRINKSVTIQAYGIGDGNIRSDVEYLDVLFGVESPKISCSNNVITLTCDTLNYDKIEYKLNSSTEWLTYSEPISISADTTIYARSSMIDSNNERIYSVVVSCKCFYGEEPTPIVLYTPVLVKYDDSVNKVYLQYNGVLYENWDTLEHDEDIAYRISYDNGHSFGSWFDYSRPISYNADCVIETYSRIGSRTSDTASYSFTYNGSSATVPAMPRIVFNPDNNIVAIYGRSDCNIYFSVDGTTFYPYTDYIILETTTTVYAYQEQISTGIRSNVASVECTVAPIPTNIDPVISFDSNAGICTISGVGKIYYKINWDKNNITREYTQPLKYINGDMSVTAWAVYNHNRSNDITVTCTWTGTHQTPNPPTIVQRGATSGYIYNEYSNVQIYWTDFQSFINSAWSEGTANYLPWESVNMSDVPSPTMYVISNVAQSLIAYSEGNENDLVLRVINSDTANNTLINSKPVLTQVDNQIRFSNVPEGATLKVSKDGYYWTTVNTEYYTPNSVYCYLFAYYIYGDTVSEVGYLLYERAVYYPTVNVYEWDSSEYGYYITMSSSTGDTIFYGISFESGSSYTQPFYNALNVPLCVFYGSTGYSDTGIKIYAASSSDIVYEYYKQGVIIKTEHHTPLPTPTPPSEWPKEYSNTSFSVVINKEYDPSTLQYQLTITPSFELGTSFRVRFTNVVYDSNTPSSFGDYYNNMSYVVHSGVPVGNEMAIQNNTKVFLPWMKSATFDMWVFDSYNPTIGDRDGIGNGEYMIKNISK